MDYKGKTKDRSHCLPLVDQKICWYRCRIHICIKRAGIEKAKELNAIPYDIPGAEYSHYGDECTFDYIVKKHHVEDEAIHQIAVIVRGADTNSFHLAPEAAGLWAISAGLSYNYKDDHEQLAIGMKIYDALYSWAKYVQSEKHTWNPNL